MDPPSTTTSSSSLAVELDSQLKHGLDMKQELAAHIHVHLLFSPGQEETWTLLERKFPKATEQQFNAAIGYLEMTDVITIDPHPHCLDEFLIKVDYENMETPPPMPWPSFRFPALDTPLGTGTVLSSVSVSENHTPLRAVRFAASAQNPAVSTSRAATEEPDDLVHGAWSHTPPRLRDALGEEDELLDSDEQEQQEGQGQGWEQEERVVEEEEGQDGGGVKEVGAVGMVGGGEVLPRQVGGN